MDVLASPGIARARVRVRRMIVASARAALALWVALLVAASGTASAQDLSARHSDLEAVFLFHFTQFVEWPSDAFATTNSPIVIGILGDHPVKPALLDVIQGEKVRGRELVVRTFRHPDEVRQCHVLFLGYGEGASAPRAIARLRGQPILLVSEIEGFAQRGGMIEFMTDRKRIKLRVNVENARAANLVISSKLLRVAEVLPKP
ncbi:MAG TPA: YfiR family protein [Verrucomicrobiae bacterium]|nr:YfiR family protein [Verrucomicrobiae bacterium]